LKTNQEYILDFYLNEKKSNSSNNLDFDFKNNKLFIGDKEIINFNKTKFLRIRVPTDKIITINSWDRKPKWDST